MSHQKAVDLDRLVAETRPVILMINHNWGGGVEKHVKELVDFFTNSATFLILRPDINEYVSVSWENKGENLRLFFRIPSEYDLLRSFFKQLGVCRIHFHHLVNVPHSIQRLPEELSIPFDVTIHDYYMICPNIFLVDENDRYCGEEGELACRKCAAHRNMDIHTWRKYHHSFLKGADRIIAPSMDTADRFKACFDDLNIIVAYHLDHERIETYPEPTFHKTGATENLRVVVMGDLSRRKGADTLNDVSVLAEQESVPLEFHLMGDAYRKLSVKPLSRLTVYGSYTESTRNSFLEKINPHIAWIPALWPETYSYVLSELMAFGVPIAATRIGAFPERLKNRSLSWIQDWDISPSEWIDFFLGIRKQFMTGATPPPIVGGSWEPVPCFSYRADYLSASDKPFVNPDKELSIGLLAQINHKILNRNNAEVLVCAKLAQLWVDTGFGYHENQVMSIVITGDEKTIEFDLSHFPDIKGLRFDPVNDYAVVNVNRIEILGLNQTHYDLNKYSANEYISSGNSYVFITRDPQILLYPENYHIQKIVFYMDYIAIGNSSFDHIMRVQNDTISGLNETIIRINEINAEQNETISEQNETISEHNETISEQNETISESLKIVDNMIQQIQDRDIYIQKMDNIFWCISFLMKLCYTKTINLLKRTLKKICDI
jgi:glycosyltransferase involved in cell wall biosynthesis/uncharacterized coiled-coil protein SlyX